MRNLFFRLPHDSETLGELGDVTSESKAWDVNTYMLANVIDAVLYAAWSVQASNAKHPPKRPKPVYRPKLTNPKPKSKKAMWPGRTIVQKNPKKEGNANG